jgi:aerobic carbon-monoxide dehydrogenase medium subunit
METEVSEEMTFYRASSVEDATRRLRENDAVLVSGGQSLMPLLRQGMINKDIVVDISAVHEHDAIEWDDEMLRLGGLATHHELVESGISETPWRVLVETAKEIGDRQVRNWGTIGGGVAHGDPSLDYPPSMTVLDATIIATDGSATSRTPIDEFYLGPYVTALAPDEIVIEVEVPAPPSNSGTAFEKFAWRKGDMSLTNAAARLTVDGTEITEARLCVGAMGPTPLRLEELEDVLVGGNADDDDHLREVADRVPEYTEPVPEEHASVEYKNRLASNLAWKTLHTAASRALGGEA